MRSTYVRRSEHDIKRNAEIGLFTKPSKLLKKINPSGERDMIKILMVTSERESFSEFATVLKKEDDVQLTWAASGQEALESISGNPVDLAVINENIGDMTAIEFMKNLLSINPMITCAAVSSLSSEEFHEASEGLGVLMQLPVSPGTPDAENLLKRLYDLKDLLNSYA
jgi:two-component SAPR family response regulator